MCSDTLDKEKFEIVGAFFVGLSQCLIMNPRPDLETAKHTIVHVHVLLIFKFHVIYIDSTSLELTQVRFTIPSRHGRHICGWMYIRSGQLVQVIDKLTERYGRPVCWRLIGPIAAHAQLREARVLLLSFDC